MNITRNYTSFRCARHAKWMMILLLIFLVIDKWRTLITTQGEFKENRTVIKAGLYERCICSAGHHHYQELQGVNERMREIIRQPKDSITLLCSRSEGTHRDFPRILWPFPLESALPLILFETWDLEMIPWEIVLRWFGMQRHLPLQYNTHIHFCRYYMMMRMLVSFLKLDSEVIQSRRMKGNKGTWKTKKSRSILWWSTHMK